MKTKILFKSMFALIFIMTFISCKKSETTTPSAPATLTGTWSVSNWVGVDGNVCTISIDATAASAVITQLGSQPNNFHVGDVLYTNITNTGQGTYTAMGKYTYGNNFQKMGFAPATLTLQKNNTQLLAKSSADLLTNITPPTYNFLRK